MKSIRKQTLIFLTLGTMVIFGLLFGISNIKLKELPKHTRNQYSEIVKARSYEVRKELRATIEQIEMLSKSPVIKTMNFDIIKEYLPNLVLEDKYRNLTIAKLNGDAYSTIGDEFNISEQEQYKGIFLDNKDYIISQPFRSPFVYEENNAIVVVAHKVVDDSNETIGLVNGVLRINFLNEIVKDISLNNNGYGWIVSKEGLIVAHPEYINPVNKSVIDLIGKNVKDIDKIFSESSGVINYLDNNNEKTLAFFEEIEDSPQWMFVVSVPEDSVYGYVNGIRNSILTALLFGLIIVTIFSIKYSNSIIKPILELKNVFEKAANGHLNVRANEDVKNELGLAAESFNTMLDRIKDLTYKDLVTDLYNYNGFLLELPYRIESLKQKNIMQAMVIISIDDFKRINSLYGYEIGDKVLRQFAKRLVDFIKEDELVARFLGDEFILFIHNSEREKIENQVRDLWEICNNKIIINDTEVLLKTSVGASLVSNNTDNFDEIINQASISKLAAKKSGGNTYKFYNYELNQSIVEEQNIENALYHAIENNELRLVYQPIIDIKTKEIVSTEALLRWDHPKYGKLSPLVIIQIAEQNGSIDKIGQWVLKEACKQNKLWQNKGHGPMVISVNVSALQFDQGDFVDYVRHILKETKMEPEYLELEITETNAMDRVEEKLIKMKKLKSMGVRISIDDFGTGYSSLAYFTRFPIDTLKIDKSFVQDMITDHNSKNIVTTIINMAKSIKLKIIAEGVENMEQLELLNKMGCDKIQGYFISRPVNPEKIEEMLVI